MSTLYVKVAISRRPVSGKPRAVRIVASYDPRVTVNNALFYAEMGFGQLNEVSLNEVIKRAQVECSARDIEVKIGGDVNKMLFA